MHERNPREQEFVRQAQGGDQGAFGEIVRLFLPGMYSFLARMTDPDTAEDLAQETFVKAWKHIQRFDANKNLKPWLLTIARNTAYDHIRKNRAHAFSEFETIDGDNPFEDSLADESEPRADEAAIAKESSARLSSALSRIPEIYRVVILLRLEENLEFEEIAKTLEKPIETLRSQYRRGTAMLRKLLDSEKA